MVLPIVAVAVGAAVVGGIGGGIGGYHLGKKGMEKKIREEVNRAVQEALNEKKTKGKTAPTMVNKEVQTDPVRDGHLLIILNELQNLLALLDEHSMDKARADLTSLIDRIKVQVENDLNQDNADSGKSHWNNFTQRLGQIVDKISAETKALQKHELADMPTAIAQVAKGL